MQYRKNYASILSNKASPNVQSPSPLIAVIVAQTKIGFFLYRRDH